MIPNPNLRDLFAMQALVGLLAHGDTDLFNTYADRAAFSYAQADAMMAEKKRRDAEDLKSSGFESAGSTSTTGLKAAGEGQ